MEVVVVEVVVVFARDGVEVVRYVRRFVYRRYVRWFEMLFCEMWCVCGVLR